MTDVPALVALIRETNHLIADASTGADRRRTIDGWTFVHGAGETVPAVWGVGDQIFWAQGEPVMIVGPDGVGKTSLGQQLALKRLTGGMLLGLTVAKTAGKVLYVAADRPAQAARSMRRMVSDEDEELLRERLIVHRGPLPFEIVKEPAWTLRGWVEEHGATDLFIDSLKDLAPKLTEDETGSLVNRAFQDLIAGGFELAVNHHQRKQQQGGQPPRAISDVYGSRWLTAGMGSVICLWDEPGDLIVKLRHLKQPIEEVGPFDVLHDHVHGRTTVHEHTNLEQLLTKAPSGLTVKDTAQLLFTKTEPNEVEKARRRLEALVGRNHAERKDDPDGTARYFTKGPA
jgi:AAA domain